MLKTSLPLFKCEKLNCKLTKRSCGKRWRLASSLRAEIIEDFTKAATFNQVHYRPCIGCAVGAENANYGTPMQVVNKRKALPRGVPVRGTT